MRIKVKHETRYQLDNAASRTIQYLRLTPRNDRNQRVLSWSITGPEQLSQWTDGFGNFNHIAIETSDHDSLSILVEGEVETKETHGVLPLDDGLPPIMFLRPSPLIESNEAIDDFLKGFDSIRAEKGTLPFLHAVMDGLSEIIAYEAGYSTVSSGAIECFEQKKGVCQDYAHLFIACCHSRNIPARYVSGYIADGIGDPASHAWAEGYVEGLGWVSFDPANRQSATEQYIRLAVGYDYTSAAPLVGVRTGGNGEDLSVSVEVSQVQTQG